MRNLKNNCAKNLRTSLHPQACNQCSSESPQPGLVRGDAGDASERPGSWAANEAGAGPLVCPRGGYGRVRQRQRRWQRSPHGDAAWLVGAAAGCKVSQAVVPAVVGVVGVNWRRPGQRTSRKPKGGDVLVAALY